MAPRTLPGELALKGFWALGEDGWNTENDINLRKLSAMAVPVAISQVTALPGSPTDGDIYVVPSGAGSNPNEIALRDDGSWVYLVPEEGWEVYVADTNTRMRYSGSAWTALTGTKATDAEVRSAAADKVMTTDLIESASAFVALTSGTSVALDWDTGVNFSLTIAHTATLTNPTNGQPGTWRTVVVTQDGTGGRTLAYGGQYQFPGGTEPVLTATIAAVDVLTILCVTASVFYVFAANDLKV